MWKEHRTSNTDKEIYKIMRETSLENAKKKKKVSLCCNLQDVDSPEGSPIELISKTTSWRK